MVLSSARDEAVETVRQRTDIVEVVSRYVKLRKAGTNHTGLCPFHAEKTPSFTVSEKKGFFHCFGCKASGDVFSFLMRVEGKTFPEVLTDLAQKAGVELPKRRPQDPRAQQLTARLLELNELAAAFYERSLEAAPKASRVRAYVGDRALTPELIKQYRIGYAPAGWRALSDYLHQKGVSAEDAVTVGLLISGAKGPYDLFRERLVFPILGLDGKVHGFGARKLDPQEEGPKYINSRQSVVFDKSETLYGLYLARAEIQKADQVLLVEGYFDVISPVGAGVPHVVATCGTALTSGHARLLRRFTDRMVMVFDADAAGRSASYRSAELLLSEGIAPYMITLPPGSDPDSFVRAQGGAALRALLEQVRPSIEVLADLARKEAAPDAEGRTRALQGLVPVLAACQDNLRLANYLRVVADRFNLGEADLRQAVETHRQKTGERRAPDRPAHPPAAAGEPLPVEEETCAVLLLKYPDLIDAFAKSGAAERFSSGPLRALITQMLEVGPFDSPAPLLGEIEDLALQGRLSGKVVDDGLFPQENARQALEDCVRKIQLRFIKDELKRIQAQIERAGQERREAEIQTLQQSKMLLTKEFAELKKVGVR